MIAGDQTSLSKKIYRLPEPADNTAIAVERIEAGRELTLPSGDSVTASHTVLLGHRFAVAPIRRGEALTSWGMPYGVATSDIQPGDYVCNKIALQSLLRRNLADTCLPDTPNFSEPDSAFNLTPESFAIGEQVQKHETPGTFMGYDRGARRGAGTRNFIVVIGTSARTAGLARTVVRRLDHLAQQTPGIDGIVPVAHTEGAGPGSPNNRNEVLRVLAGFLVHPNTAAVIALDDGDEPVNNRALKEFCQSEKYPLDEVPHQFVSAGGDPQGAIAQCESIVREWIPSVGSEQRKELSLSGLKIALQCGGSDAFSGVSGNPLAAQIAKEIIRHGGTAVQAETDEIIGAERYMIQSVRDSATAERLIAIINRFEERLSWHGTTAEGNPSEGNRLRGLYNILLKSLGAAAKKAPDVRLEEVIDYGQPLNRPGFVFMDSPGNDLESIAGEVASGCNLVLFVTGNGSITNFPFVPTLKITTTTARHLLLENEMDINAGEYLDGIPMRELTRKAFDLVVETASGARSKGELARHSQVSIWRNWQRTSARDLDTVEEKKMWSGQPIAITRDPTPVALPMIHGWQGDRGSIAAERLGLIVPVSLCAGQVAQLVADRLQSSSLVESHALSRFVALPHTEGCGFTGDDLLKRLLHTYTNYARHPNVAAALFLEHGCEKTPNDLVRSHVEASGLHPDDFGWASIQLDGGIESVSNRIESWFTKRLSREPPIAERTASLADLNIAIVSCENQADTAAGLAAELVRMLLSGHGSVMLPSSDSLLSSLTFIRALTGDSGAKIDPTLALAQWPETPGLHIIDTQTDVPAENVAALGASGVQVVIALNAPNLMPTHPMFPVVRIPDPNASSGDIFNLVAERIGARRLQDSDEEIEPVFQLTRGLLGIST